ncbi:hypothetical protein ATCC90586_007388 [Pythium insidiosum]|nr:hypothetical protein ATCC90586_007388 [Pythium insidiosum]
MATLKRRMSTERAPSTATTPASSNEGSSAASEVDLATPEDASRARHGDVHVFLAPEPAATAASTNMTGAETPVMIAVGGTDAAAGEASAMTAAPGDDESLPPVKKRRTKNFKWREDMAKKSRPAGPMVITRVPPLEPVTFNNWDEFIAAWTDYMAATKTLYRRRSSCSTAIWNSRNRYKKYPVPESFPYATMAYWCTHGCIQPSRGTGVRAHLHNRFTGCTARVTADVVFEKTDETHVRWFIRVRNQISQHNHRISDEIYNCYTNNSSVPDELLLGEMVGPDAAMPQLLPPPRSNQSLTT